jgi:ornithine cyclodeaminase
VRLIDRDAIDGVLDFPAVIDALASAFAGGFIGPARHHHTLDQNSGATQLLMPAWTNDLPRPGSFLGTKIVSIFPQNSAQRIAAVNGSYVLQSGETGLPLAVFDGTRLTHWRTAAVSALGSRYLARPNACRLLVCGAGALAPMLIVAHGTVRAIEKVFIWNHHRAGAEKLVGMFRAEGWDAHVAEDLPRAVAQADIVSCATLAREPFLRGDWLSPGAHVDLVGSFNLRMREADAVTLQRARIFIDTARALTEGGDVALAIAAHEIAQEQVAGGLAQLIAGSIAGRRDAQEITLLKSVGTAIADLAVAILVWQRVGVSPDRKP